MKQHETIKKLLDVANGNIQHRIIDCSQPCGTPEEWHDVKNCKACKIIKEAKILYSKLKELDI